MARGHPEVLAVVFDFDDTLVDDTTTQLLVAHGIDPERFWRTDVAALVNDGYDPALAYLRLLLEEVGPGGALGELTASRLVEFGRSMDGQFYRGLPELFEELKAIAHRYRDITLEFYIISGGLQNILDGSEIVKRYFTAAYGCQLGANDSGLLRYIKRAVTFTEKTRYLFEINKGLEQREAAANPYLVNEQVPQERRRIPFRNIVYVGDGLTDIPCFSLVQAQGGTAFGVFNPASHDSAKKAFLDFLRPGRVITMNAPHYLPDDELGALLRTAIEALCAGIEVARRQV